MTRNIKLFILTVSLLTSAAFCLHGDDEGLGCDIGGGVSFELSDRLIDSVLTGDNAVAQEESLRIFGSTFKLGLEVDIYYRFNNLLSAGVETGVYAFGVSPGDYTSGILPVFDVPLRIFGRLSLGFMDIQAHGGYNFASVYDFDKTFTSQVQSSLDYARINNKFDFGATLGLGPFYFTYSYLFWLDGYTPYEDSHKATMGVKLTLF